MFSRVLPRLSHPLTVAASGRPSASAKAPAETAVRVLNGLVLHAVRSRYSSSDRSIRRSFLLSGPSARSR